MLRNCHNGDVWYIVIRFVDAVWMNRPFEGIVISFGRGRSLFTERR